MALPDLTNQKIKDTYQRVLQVSSSGDITDGTGSLFIPPTASHAITALTEITKEVSSSYSETASMASSNFIVQGNITASGDISSSGTISSNILDIDSDIQVGGDLVFTQNGAQQQHVRFSQNNDQIYWDGDAIIIAIDDEDQYNFRNSGLGISGNITASGDISSSGIVTALSGSFTSYQGNFLSITSEEQKIGDHTGIDTQTHIKLRQSLGRMDVNCLNGTEKKIVLSTKNLIIDDENSTNTQRTKINGSITSSGDISSSGLISAANFHVPGQGRISFDNEVTDDQFIKGLDNSIVIDGDDTIRLKADNYVEFADDSNNAKVSIDGNNGHITASSNISSSGKIIAKELDIEGSNVKYDASNNILKIADNIKLGIGTGVANTVGDLTIQSDGANVDLTANAGNVLLNSSAGNTIIKNNYAGGNILLQSDKAGSGQAGGVVLISGSNPQVSLDVRGNITASGDISSSGTITAETIMGATSGDIGLLTIGTNDRHLKLQGGYSVTSTNPKITSDDASTIEIDKDLLFSAQTKAMFDSTDTYIAADSDNPENLEIHADNDIQLMADRSVDISSNVTASGNISASGNIIGATGSFTAISASGGIFLGATPNASKLSFTSIADSGNKSYGMFQVVAANHVRYCRGSGTENLLDLLTAQNDINPGTAQGIILSGSLKIVDGLNYPNTGNIDVSGGSISASAALVDQSISTSTVITDRIQHLQGIGITVDHPISASSDISCSAELIAHRRFDTPADSPDNTLGSGADILYHGQGSTIAGRLYVMGASSEWVYANATAEETSTGLLGIARGTNPNVDGMLIRGTVKLSQGDIGSAGEILYVGESNGQITNTRPSTANDIVRIVGYALDDEYGKIFFDPDKTFVKVS
tara:strand:- start:2027 stop:4657 length:2631 start_codon:yes stop_codon:yes gene_type:complete